MKTYHLLKPTDIIQEGDMFPSTNRPIAPERMRLIPEEYFGKQAGKLLVFRPMPEPQWQTGPIPEPMGLAVLVLEGPVFGHIKTFSDEHNGEWYWCKALGHSIGIATLMEEPSDFDLTGRWCITPLNLPVADGIGTPEDANRN